MEKKNALSWGSTKTPKILQCTVQTNHNFYSNIILTYCFKFILGDNYSINGNICFKISGLVHYTDLDLT
jgi:hypothetical protein